MGEYVVEVRNLHKIYPDGTVALRGVSLGFRRGEVHVVLGENGASPFRGILITQFGAISVISINKDSIFIEPEAILAIAKEIAKAVKKDSPPDN
ncbi:MAG TPA: hypothetical protein EYP32_05720, partial [Aquificaceae bacterium]|nr:hypothetical protein [Aquificaceae bacterium]